MIDEINAYRSNRYSSNKNNDVPSESIMPTGDAPKNLRPPFLQRLSTKFLLLSILCVLAAQVLIFVPSIAAMRTGWLETKLASVAPVSLLIEQNTTLDIPQHVQDMVLLTTDTKAIILHNGDQSRIIAIAELPTEVVARIDLNQVDEAEAISGAFKALLYGGNNYLSVTGRIGDGSKSLEMIINDSELHKDLIRFSRNIALLSLLISVLAASFIYLIINNMLVRPVIRMHRNMIGFTQTPDDPSMIITPDERVDELGIAQRQLAYLQSNLQRTFVERKHLADLGLAVSKINHDLRNILASAQLISDSLTEVQDPYVKRLTPRLLRALDRAIQYTQTVIAYGRSQEAPVNIHLTNLHLLVKEIQDSLHIASETGIEFQNNVSDDFEFYADSDQLYRVLYNLLKNSVQAITQMECTDPERLKRISIDAKTTDKNIIIDIQDTGPGLPKLAKDYLFVAFRGSTRKDGTGLGLAIAHELIRAHGGTIQHIDDTEIGAHFQITLPRDL